MRTFRQSCRFSVGWGVAPAALAACVGVAEGGSEVAYRLPKVSSTFLKVARSRARSPCRAPQRAKFLSAFLFCSFFFAPALPKKKRVRVFAVSDGEG